ncbi:MAG: hypothetical protein ACQR33_00320 [Candidatus Saccharibacteria bacterium]
MEEFTPDKKPRAKHAKKNDSTTKIVAIVIVAIVGLSASFVAGVQFQKAHGTTKAVAAQNGGFGGTVGGFGGRMRDSTRVFGQVAAVSSTSITVSTRQGTSTTLSISSNTTVINNGATAAITDIATGDTVMITRASSTATAAESIELNPTFSGPSQSGPSTTNGSSLDTTTN